jgi:RNA polymerase sigma-70 factor (ECF subfamily)
VNSELYSDLTLVTKVAVFRDNKVFDQLVRKYQSPVRRFLLNLTLGNDALADDLAQDTFLKAYQNIGQFRGTASLQTWLMRIAYNTFYDYKRQNKHEHTGMDDAKTAYQLNAMHTHDAPVGEKLDVRTALAQLSEDERTCITLQMIDGEPIDHIAQITGMPANTVKSHLKRGKEKMKNFLIQNGYDGKRQ